MATLSLGAFTQWLRGKSGNTVFFRTREGVGVRDYTLPTQPNTPAQVDARERLRVATLAWSLLSPEQAAAWREYAQSLGTREPGGGAVRVPRSQTVFIGLAAKFLQVNPGSSPPVTPPASVFLGDAIGLSVEAVEGGGVRFTASGPNQGGVVTELLLQRLRNGASLARPSAFRTQGFVAFEEGSLSVVVPASPGWVACGYRFVRASTGQMSPVIVAGSLYLQF